MLKRALVLIVFLIIAFGTVASADNKFVLDVTFHNNTTTQINDVSVVDVPRTTSFYHVDENVSLDARDGSGNYLYTEPIGLSFSNYIRTQDGGIEVESETVQKDLYIPYNRSIEQFDIRFNDTVTASVSLPTRLCINDGTCTAYCDGRGIDVDCTCGDSTCQDHESDELCPQDCDPSFNEDNETGQGDDPGETGTTPVDPGLGGDESESRSPLGYIFLGLVVLVGIGLVIWFVREVET